MANRNNEVSLRLSVKGRDELISTMKDMGGEYEKAARKIEAGSRKANTGMKAVDKTAKELNGSIQGMAARGGSLTSVLAGLGPVGAATGAGLATIGVALAGAMRISREAISAFDQIGKSADTLLLSTDAFQALNSAAIDEGVNFAKVEQAVRALDKRHSELAANQGELYTRLKDINPELVEMLRNTVDNDARLRIMTTALQQAETATQRSTIAYAAFGEGGADVARMLVRQADGMDGMIARAKELGLVVDEDLIRSAEDMENQFGQASKVIDLQLKTAFVELAPIMLESAKLMADVATMIAGVSQAALEFDKRTDESIAARLEDLTQKMLDFGASKEAVDKALATGLPLEASEFDAVTRMLAGDQVEKFNALTLEMVTRGERDRQRATGEIRRRMTTEQLEAEREALRDHLAQMDAMTTQQRQSGEIGLVEDPFAPDRAEAQRVLAQINAEINRRGTGGGSGSDTETDARAEAERNRLRAEAVRLQKELGDYTAHVAEKTERWQAMLDAGFITQQQYDAAVKNLKDELSGVADAQERWAKLIEDSMSPTAAVRLQISALNADHEAGRISAEMHAKALEELNRQLAEAAQGELEAKPGWSDAETIRADLDSAATDAMTPAEKLAKETERVNALVSDGVLEGEDATDWLELYGKRLEETAEKSRMLTSAEELLDGVQAGRIQTLDDLGRAFSAMLIKMVQEYLTAQQSMKGGSFLDFLMGGGQGGAGAGGEGGGGFLSSIGSFFGFGSAGQSHSGGAGNRPPNRRPLAGAMYPGEGLTVVQDSETILTASGRMNIAGQIQAMASERQQMAGLVSQMAAGRGTGAGGVNVNVNNYAGAEVEVTQSEGPDGPEVSVDIKGKLKEMADGGVFDGPFKRRYGLTPAGA